MMTPHAILFTLASIGIAETAYLIKKRMTAEPPVCPLGESCNTVLESKYNRLFGVHNDMLGFVFYFSVGVITALLVFGVGLAEFLNNIMRIIIFGGFFISVFLVYLQWKVIKAWCSWCLASAMTIFLMAVIILTNDLIIL